MPRATERLLRGPWGSPDCIFFPLAKQLINRIGLFISHPEKSQRDAAPGDSKPISLLSRGGSVVIHLLPSTSGGIDSREASRKTGTKPRVSNLASEKTQRQGGPLALLARLYLESVESVKPSLWPPSWGWGCSINVSQASSMGLALGSPSQSVKGAHLIHFTQEVTGAFIHSTFVDSVLGSWALETHWGTKQNCPS